MSLDPVLREAYQTEVVLTEGPDASDVARLAFTSDDEVIQGTVTVGGKVVGEVGVYPNEDDPVSTDYVRFDVSEWPSAAYEVRVDGRRAGPLKIMERFGQPGPSWGTNPDPPAGDDALPAEHDDEPYSDPTESGDGPTPGAPSGPGENELGVDVPTSDGDDIEDGGAAVAVLLVLAAAAARKRGIL